MNNYTIVTTIDTGTHVQTLYVFSDAATVGPPADVEITATIIADWGGPLSNSYVTETEVNSYLMTAVTNNMSWLKTDWRARKAAMIEATIDIDSRSYIGQRYYYDQRLEFPRQLAIAFPWNRTWASSTIWSVEMGRMMEDVKKAASLQTLHILRTRGREQGIEAIVSGIKQRSSAIGGSVENVKYSRDIRRLGPEAIILLADWMTTRKVLRG
jgi:hypothetical protein